MPYIGNASANRFVAPKAATQFSGDGSTTAFTLDHAVGSDEDILVSVDGVIQEPSVAYAVSNGTTLTFTAAPSSNSGNNIFVYYLFRTVGTVSHPSSNALSATSGTFSTTLASTGNATVGGTLGVGSTNAPTSSSGGNLIAIETTADEHTNLVFNTANTAKNGIIEGRRTGRGSYERFAQINLQNDSDNGEIRFYTAASGSDVEEKMRIDSAGAITMPLQPAFQARPQSPGYTQNIALSTVVDVNFGNEIFDRNGDFSSNTFTAPVTGLYQLNLSAYVENLDTASTYFQLNIATSNRNYVIIIDPNFSSDLLYFSKTVSVLADMDANDTAVVQAYQVGGTAQTDIVSASTFSGYLVA